MPRKRRRVNMKKIARIVQKATQKVTTHRVNIAAVPTASADNFYTLLTCDDDPNYDLASDGSNVAECESNSRIVKIDLRVEVYDSTGAGLIGSLLLARDPDTALGTNLTIANLMSPDYTTQNAEVKKNVMLARRWIFDSNFLVHRERLRMKRQAFKRTRNLRDGDKLLINYSAPAGTTHNILIFGRIWTAK